MSHIISVDSQNFDSLVKDSPKPIIMDLYAPWCGPCKTMAPLFEELSQELNDHYTFAQLNIDETREIAIQLGVMSIPTFLFFKQGELVGQELGYMSKEELKEKILQHLG
jgi:thioredoxin 1